MSVVGEVRKAAGGGLLETELNVFTEGERRLWPADDGGCCKCMGVGVCSCGGKMLEELVLVLECE